MDFTTVIGLILIIVGIVLLIVEMFIPGFGVFGISGLAALVLGVIGTAKSFSQALSLCVIILVILVIALTIILISFHSGKLKSPIRLEEELPKDGGFINSEDLAYMIDKEGITITDLRPTGKCDFDGVSFEVRSENSFIEKGKKVRVIRIQTKALIVCEI